MIFGMSLYTFTVIHVIISLIGIATGLVVAYGMLNNDKMERWTAVFLISTVLTSVTGFGFPFTKLLPSHIVGIISLVVLRSCDPCLLFVQTRGRVAFGLHCLRD